MQQTPSLDIVTVVIAIASWFLGGDVAQIVGPYSVILLSSLGGAAWSASRLPPTSRRATMLHISLSIGLALIATVPLSELLANVAGLQARWTLAPAAVIIAARPDWVWRQVLAVLSRGPK